MTIDEAKTILQSYRPNEADAGDPVFAEALKLAQDDRELRGWFERQQRFDRALSRQMSHVAPPRELRDRILKAAASEGGGTSALRPETSGEPAIASADDQAQSKPAWWRSAGTRWLAVAAAVALLLGAGVAVFQPKKIPVAQSALAAIAIEDAEDGSKHLNHSAQATELRKKMNQPTTKLADLLPIDYDSLHENGCRTVKVEGREVVEFCFRRNGAGHHWYIARRDDFPKVAAPAVPEVTKEKGASIATWADETHVYVLVTKPDANAFEKML